MRNIVTEDFPLLQLHGDKWKVTDALQGTHIFGATGSGKTSGSGQEIALNMLESGMGGLVLTVKPDETDLWLSYCASTKREAVVFGPRITEQTPYSFNFLEYERMRAVELVKKRYPEESETGQEAIASSFLTENLVNLFSALMEVAQRGGGGGAKNDAYWQNAVRQLLRNALDLLLITGCKLTFQNLYEIITTAPQSKEAAEEIIGQANRGEKGTFVECVRALGNLGDDNLRSKDGRIILSYWLREYPGLAPETRSIVLSFFTTAADPFLRGTLRQLFSPEDESPQLDPEIIREGKVVIINLPVKQYFELGQFAQVLYKLIFQRAMERSTVEGIDLRPVFLWADEAQFFLCSQDMLFQTTARSAKVATVYLTQNISSYYALMPGEQGRAQTDSLLGNFVTKIFHTNTDSVTNLWASELISKVYQYKRSISSSESMGAPTPRSGRGATLANVLFGGRAHDTHGFNITQNEVFDYQVPPIEFTKLASGGERNKLLVTAIFVQGGRTTPEGKNFQALVFEQSRIENEH
jgi:hypothetical protein